MKHSLNFHRPKRQSKLYWHALPQIIRTRFERQNYQNPRSQVLLNNFSYRCDKDQPEDEDERFRVLKTVTDSSSIQCLKNLFCRDAIGRTAVRRFVDPMTALQGRSAFIPATCPCLCIHERQYSAVMRSADAFRPVEHMIKGGEV